MAERQKTLLIRQFIIESVDSHPSDIAKVTANRFKISRQAVASHLQKLVDQAVILPVGNTKARTYKLQAIAHEKFRVKLAGQEEHVVWMEKVNPLVSHAPDNVKTICDIAFSEMLNNAIDHSGSEFAEIDIKCTATTIRMRIIDHGIGIFRKIKEEYGLHDERESILELAKGKLTTSPDSHSGYGVFITSRMVDIFSMSSGKLFFTHIKPDDDWLIELDRKHITGTRVELLVSMMSDKTATEVYDQFFDVDSQGDQFIRTHVPIRLAQYGSGQLVSRSQAKRVLLRFEKFSEVLIDFRGIDFIGQAFADEIFRVYPSSNPSVDIAYVNANDSIRTMIRLALS